MASWNEKREGEELVECPVCYVFVAKKRLTTHVTKCYETYENTIDERGLIRCPLYPLHIMPKKYLNHHLEGNCEEAQNLLRKYFQKKSLQSNLRAMPPIFLADVPDELLSPVNKLLLYILRKDLQGNSLINDKELYPDDDE